MFNVFIYASYVYICIKTRKHHECNQKWRDHPDEGSPLLYCTVQLFITTGASGIVTFMPLKAECRTEMNSILGGTPSTCIADVTLYSLPVPAYLFVKLQ